MLVPVVVALAALVHVLGGSAGSGSAGAPAEVSGSSSTARADLPVLPVDVPPVTPEADAACPALMKTLPL